MGHFGTHYENAFESYLQARSIRYVRLDQARKAVFSGSGIKSFDFIVYPEGGNRHLLVDVKGRKVPLEMYQKGAGTESWVTADDVEGLKSWEDVFGEDYQAVFVFAYWLVRGGDDGEAGEAELGWFEDLYSFGGREYVFWVVGLSDYALWAKQRSPKWKTVYVPRKRFGQLARSMHEWMLQKYKTNANRANDELRNRNDESMTNF